MRSNTRAAWLPDNGATECTTQGYMGSFIGGEPGADMIQASGQASSADLVWVEMSKHMEEQHITSSSSVDLDTE